MTFDRKLTHRRSVNVLIRKRADFIFLSISDCKCFAPNKINKKFAAFN